MIKDALEYLVGLGAPNWHTVGELEYSDKEIDLLTPPTISRLAVRSLSALCDLITEGFEGLDAKQVFLVVEGPTLVELISKASNAYGQRKQFAVANCAEDLPRYQFGQFVEPEQFVINLQSMFVPGVGDTDYVLRTASNLASENVAKAEDDGIAQKATVRRGVTLGAQETIKARVSLAPYRTFREADQPASDFLFRLKSRDNAPPMCALFEADGGKWKIDAMKNVNVWLSRNAINTTVIS